MHACKDNPENSFTTKVSKRVACVYSISTIHAFDNEKGKHDKYRGKDCMKKFFKDIRKHAINIIN